MKRRRTRWPRHRRTKQFQSHVFHLQGKRRLAKMCQRHVPPHIWLVRDFGSFPKFPMSAEWAKLLRGGAQGAHVSKRKRQEKRARAGAQSGLASALQDFLAQWNPQPQQKRMKSQNNQQNDDSSLANSLWQNLQSSIDNQEQDHVLAQKIKSSLGRWQRSPGTQASSAAADSGAQSHHENHPNGLVQRPHLSRLLSLLLRNLFK